MGRVEEEGEVEEEGQPAAMYNLMRFSRLPAMDVFLIQFALSARQVICQMCHVLYNINTSVYQPSKCLDQEK